MTDHNPSLLTKSFGISYAVFRVSAYIKSPSFADYFEHQALRLLDQATQDDLAKIKHTLIAIEYYCRLGREIGVIEESNATAIIREIERVRSGIAESGPSLKEPQPLMDLFPFAELTGNKKTNKDSTLRVTKKAHSSVPTPPRTKRQSGLVSREDAYGSSDKRQGRIMEFLASHGNSHLKDIQTAMPDVSERTIRYDLKKLLESAKVERVGGGGPFSYYRMRRSELLQTA